MAAPCDYAIIGGGPAACSAVEGIRARDASGSILMVCGEPHLPYDRPPLSKGLWLGKTKREELPLKDEAFYAANHVSLRRGVRATGIDPKSKVIRDSGGEEHSYGKLLLATGGTPRRLPFGGELVQYYRTIEDYEAVRQAADRGDDFVIIGGGFIGGELSASLCHAGRHVTLVFPDAYLLQRVFPADLAAFMRDYYRSRGVMVLPNESVVDVRGRKGEVTVVTNNGKALTARSVVAAIGLALNVDLAAHAGLKIDDGIVVDRYLRTSEPDVFAAGDVAHFPAKALGRSLHIEHWNNAQSQGKHAGENMAGAEAPFTYLPFFWSDLFDLGFEAIGVLDSRLTVFADWKEKYREGVVYYLDAQRVKGVLLWNVWEKVPAARALIEKGEQYRDPTRLKGLLTS